MEVLQVITPSFNNVSDFQAIKAVGAKPVLCDVYDKTLTINFEKAEKLVAKKTKAIIVMDYNCFIVDHDKAKRFATKHNIKIKQQGNHFYYAYNSMYNDQIIWRHIANRNIYNRL